MPPSFESNFRMSDEEFGRLLMPALDCDGRNLSQIAQFYEARGVFVTGGTGFVGRLLIEKLLRSCVNIGRIYVLMRPKRGKGIEERMRDLTGSIVFDGLRKMGVNLGEKLVPIEGHLSEPSFGLKRDQLELLAREVSLVFHSAASVNFQEPLRDATCTNLIGTMNALELAKQLPKLVALVYVSTAYSNCNQRGQISEHVYEAQLEPKALVRMTDILDRNLVEKIKPALLEEFPNTYTYTKNLAEFLCLQNAKLLPVAICRPSVVASTWREPIEGFVDNINGGNGINYGPASGLSVVMQADNSVVLDYVPVDVVVNCVIAIGWFCATYNAFRRENFTTREDDGELQQQLALKMGRFHERKLQEFREAQLSDTLIDVPVFHATSGVENPIKFGDFKNKMINYARKFPTLQLYRCPQMSYVRSKRLYTWTRFFRNTLVAKLFDFLYGFNLFKPTVLDKSDPIAKKSLAFRSEKIDHFGQTIVYFLTNHWDFRPENRHMLIDEFMSDEDKRLFPIDMRQLNWDEFCRVYALGIRKFLLKEPNDSLGRARSRLGIISAANSTIKTAVIVLLVFSLYLILY